MNCLIASMSSKNPSTNHYESKDVESESNRRYYLHADQEIISKDGKQYTVIESRIGWGAQGTIYKVKDQDDNIFALKWYKEDTVGDDELYQRVKQMCACAPPSPVFIWPISCVETDYGRGYIMEYVRHYEPLSKIMYVSYSSEGLKEIALKIARSFQKLHDSDLCFRDINDEDILVNLETGDIRICDCDNVAKESIYSSVKGRMGFIAPEIYLGSPHDKRTDCHSILTIIFKLFVRRHPLEGIREDNLGDRKIEDFYGKDALFIFDQYNGDNAPPEGDVSNKTWEMMSYYIQELFVDAFQNGLHDPDYRPDIHTIVDNLERFAKSGDYTGETISPATKKKLNLLFIVDNSGSMSKHGRIQSVNKLIDWVINDMPSIVPHSIEIVSNVLTFNDKAEWIFQRPKKIDEIKVDDLKIDVKKYSHSSLNKALNMLNHSLNAKEGFLHRSLTKPCLILITDGEPTNSIDKEMDMLKRNTVFLESQRFAFILDEECTICTMRKFTGDSDFIIRPETLSMFEILFKVIAMRTSILAANPPIEDDHSNNAESLEDWAHHINESNTPLYRAVKKEMIQMRITYRGDGSRGSSNPLEEPEGIPSRM